MKEQIYTIPINQAFDQACGCPLCTLQRDLEQKSLDYVMGAAMMEPDVRIATNEAGFCRRHFSAMLSMKNRLSLALMMQSHLKEVSSSLDASLSSGGSSHWGKGKKDDPIDRLQNRCYVCERIESFFSHYISNILYLYDSEPAFREKFLNQPFFCLSHQAALQNAAQKELKPKVRSAFFSDLHQVQTKYLHALQERIDTFCKSFDYRFSNLDLSTAKNSCEQAGEFLTGLPTL